MVRTSPTPAKYFGLVLGLVAVATGCASSSGTRVSSGGATPATLPAKAAASPDIDPATSGPLTLAQLLSFAEANGPGLTVAKRRALRGDAEVEGAETLVPYNPSLSIGAGARRAGGVSRFEFQAQVQQRIEIAGQRGARIEAAKHSREAQTAEVEVVRWELRAQVRALYYKLLVRKRQLAAAEKLESFVADMRKVIEKRIDAGEESPLRTIVARAELAKLTQQVIAARQAHRQTSLRLVEVVGWPGAKLEVTGTLGPAELVIDSESLARSALENHPSKRWLALEVRAAEARLAREKREAWPDPAVGLSYGREAEPGGAVHVWMGRVSVPIPLWQQNQAGKARARADLQVARAERLVFERVLKVRIAAAVARVQSAAESSRLFGSDILPAFESNLAKLKRAFELGEIDILTLSQIQQRVLLTQQSSLQALDAYYEALAALEALSGVDLRSGGSKAP